ncbi:unnamed protein product [Alopecurus aequalis]
MAHPGCTFDVADHVLIDEFLLRKLAGLPIDARSKIHDVDAYSLWPDDLVHNREHSPEPTSTTGKGATGTSSHRRIVTAATGGGSAPGTRRVARNPLGWCVTEFGLDDASAGLVLCKVYVSTHKTETTYASVMKATAESKKTKAGDEPHPDAPRPQTPRRQESEQRQELERWLLSNEDDAMPAGAVDDGSVDPAGFFADILQEFGGARAEPAQDDSRWECTMEELLGEDNMELVAPAPELVTSAPSHVCSNSADCGICIQQMLDELIEH